MGEILERMMLIALSMILLSSLFPIFTNMGLEFQIYSENQNLNSMDLIENDIEGFKIKLDNFLVEGSNYANESFTFGGLINIIVSETLSDSKMIIIRFSNVSMDHPIYKTVNIQEEIQISVLSIEVGHYSIISKNSSDFIYFY